MKALCFLAACRATELALKTGDSVFVWGSIEVVDKALSFVPSERLVDAPASTPSCIGVVDGGSFECHTMFSPRDGQLWRNVEALVDGNGQLLHVQVRPGPELVVVQKPATDAVPEVGLLRPLGVDAEIKVGAEVEVEKSFLQKYWMYVLPVALLLLLQTGGGGGEAAA